MSNVARLLPLRLWVVFSTIHSRARALNREYRVDRYVVVELLDNK